MKIALHLSDFGWPVGSDALADLLADVAGLAEAGGYDGVAVGDW